MKITHNHFWSEGDVSGAKIITVEDESCDKCVWAIRELAEERIFIEGSAPQNLSGIAGTFKADGCKAEWVSPIANNGTTKIREHGVSNG